MSIQIIQGDNLDVMKTLQSNYYTICYSDVPFGTNKTQKRGEISYTDSFDNYKSFLYPRIEETFRLLNDNGSFFLHMDYRWVHYAKVWCDEIFGKDHFINEIIWSYDFGARTKNRWPTKHDNILFYAKNPKKYIFRYDQIDRIPYLAPGLVGPEKAARGKTRTDVWQNTIVPTMSKENLKYPTQKPQTILKRIVKVHSFEGQELLDWCAGSGSFGQAAIDLGRNCTLIDNNPKAIEVMKKRFSSVDNVTCRES